MLLIERTSARTLHRHQIIRATLALVHIVSDPRGWEVEHAAGLLRHELDDDERLIRLVRARVLDAMHDRPAPVDQRALRTLDRALLMGQAHD